MKSFIFLALAFLPIKSFCQQHWGTIGLLKNNQKQYLVYKSCDFSNGTPELCREVRHFILADTTCNGFIPAYVILYKDSVYFVSPYYFKDTNVIRKELLSVKGNVPSISERLLIAKKIKNELDYKDSISSSFSKIRKQREKDSIEKQEWVNFYNLLEQYASNNVVIKNISLSYSSKYSSFAEFNVSVFNPYKKKIKYISFVVQAFNAVGDPAIDQLTGKSIKTLTGIGPIEFANDAEYNFETAFYSKIVNNISIKQIKIQFFDGTTKTINKPKSLNIE